MTRSMRRADWHLDFYGSGGAITAALDDERVSRPERYKQFLATICHTKLISPLELTTAFYKAFSGLSREELESSSDEVTAFRAAATLMFSRLVNSARVDMEEAKDKTGDKDEQRNNRDNGKYTALLLNWIFPLLHPEDQIRFNPQFQALKKLAGETDRRLFSMRPPQYTRSARSAARAKPAPV